MKKALGERIKLLRKSKGHTQENFAELLGVSFQAVSKWERGESYPDISYLPTISRILNTSIDDLLGNTAQYPENEIKQYLELYDNCTFENQKEVYFEFDKAAKLYPNDFRIQIRYMDLINRICALITTEEYENKDFVKFDKESRRIECLYRFINDTCNDDSIRDWAKRIMCEHFKYIYDCNGFGGVSMFINGMKFVNDESVIGKWSNIGWTEDLNNFSIDNLNNMSGDYRDLYLLPNGESYWFIEGWTKGTLFIHYGGNEPILSYKYDTKNIDGKTYFFLRLDDKTEVFVKVDSVHYCKETLGNHDNINMPFISDDKVIGKWNSVGFVNNIQDFSIDNQIFDLPLKYIEFKADGTVEQKYMDDEIWHDKWTAGYVLNLHRTTAAKYEIHNINGAEYLFLEWKMGNYIYGDKVTDFYVFSR